MGNLINEFPNPTEASRITENHNGDIGEVYKGKRTTADGYMEIYLNLRRIIDNGKKDDKCNSCRRICI